MQPEMFNKIPATIKLSFLVLILCGFIVGIGFYGIRELRVMNRTTETLYGDRVIPLEQLTTIRYSYAITVFSAAQQVYEKKLTYPQALKQIQQGEKIIQGNWDAYKKTYLTHIEKELISQIEPFMTRANLAIDTLENALKKEDQQAMSAIMDKGLWNSISPLISKLNELVLLQINVSDKLSQNNKTAYTSTAKKFYIAIGVSLIVALVLAFLIVGNNRRFINQLQASNRKIAASEEKCRAFIEYAGDAILILDEDFFITDVNKSACELLGYTATELVQLNLSDVIPVEEHESIFEKAEVIEKMSGSLHERKFKRKDGSYVDTEVNVRDLKGQGYVSVIRDITERKLAEQAIKDSERQYRYLFDNAPAFIIIWDLEKMEVLEVNEGVIEKYGYSREEWIGMSALQYRPHEDHDLIKDFAKRMLAGGEPKIRTVWRHLKKSGEMMQMEITSHKIIYKKREAILSLARDVTDQLKAEAELRKSEEKHRALVEHIGDAITLISKEGELLYRSPSVERINGYSFDEAKKRTILDFIHPDDKERCAKYLEKVYASPRVPMKGEFRLQHKRGNYIWIEATLQNLYNVESVKALVINYRDITERKNAEKLLIESEEKFRSLVEESLVGVYILQDGKFKYINPAFQKAIGYSKEMLLGKLSFDDLVHDEDLERIKENYALRLSGENPRSQYIFRAIKSDGSVLHLEIVASTIMYEGKPSIIGTLMDITDRVEEEKRINKAVNDAQEKERMQIGMELHDNVKQILAASLMNLDHVTSNLDNKIMAKGILDNLKNYIREAIDELRRLSHQLAPSINAEDSLKDKIERLVQTMNKGDQLKFSVNVAEFKKPLNNDLQTAFYRILQEQLNNIVKHAKASSVQITVQPDHQNIILSIKDDGQGFDTTLREGGIGLENIKRRAYVLGGDAKVISSPGNGCEVNVQIPFSRT